MKSDKNVLLSNHIWEKRLCNDLKRKFFFYSFGTVIPNNFNRFKKKLKSCNTCRILMENLTNASNELKIKSPKVRQSTKYDALRISYK